MKIAEGYNLTGNENVMGLKNQLLPFLDFAQPYRYGIIDERAVIYFYPSC